MPRADALDLETFRRTVAETGELELDAVLPESRFVEDLGFDSLRLLELMAALVDLGIDVPEDVTLEGRTVERAFEIAAANRPDEGVFEP